MAANTPNLPIHRERLSANRAFTLRRAVIAGWTGRDPNARETHVGELEALGVSPPASMPVSAGGLAEGTAPFCGTSAASGGIRLSKRFSFELYDPARDAGIAHTDYAAWLPIAG